MSTGWCCFLTFLIGLASGLRTFTGVAAVCWAAHRAGARGIRSGSTTHNAGAHRSHAVRWASGDGNTGGRNSVDRRRRFVADRSDLCCRRSSSGDPGWLSRASGAGQSAESAGHRGRYSRRPDCHRAWVLCSFAILKNKSSASSSLLF